MLITKFEEQVKRNPGKLAVKGENESFTYEELDSAAERVCQLIKRVGGSCSTVGLLLEHGPQMIVAILGALKAGKTYVPISADYPENRISYMLSNSQASLIVTNSKNMEMAGHLGRENNIHVLDININNEVALPQELEKLGAPGDSIAYIMYTSGSTGRPKGVTQTHTNVLYYTRNWSRLFSITASDRMTLFSSFCHDGSVQDMFSALLNGATIYPYDLKNRAESSKLSEFLINENITIWHSVPSLFSYFCTTLSGKEKFPELRFILLGGEPIREHEINTAGKLFPHPFLVNVYGQTESSVNSVWIIGQGNAMMNRNMKLRIGEPLDETKIFVVDADGNEVDMLAQGEIVVCSSYLSPGYWRDPESTRKTFSEDEEIGRLYWTGDLGRLLPGNEIEFLGRKDFQVKIRGYRIELGEIENVLLKHEKIKEAVVTAREKGDGEKYLVAYYTPSTKNPEPLKVQELKDYLSGELPDYMMPGVFMELEQFPLTQSKKIDRKALPEPVDPVTQALQASAGEYAAPRNPIEERVAEFWGELLGLDKARISIDANFFELGGHSLKATIMAAKIHQAFAVKIPFAQMFERYTIRSLAEYISGNSGQIEGRYTAIEAVEKKEYYPLSSAQKRLFFLHQMDMDGTGYHISTTLEFVGDIHLETLTDTFKKLIHRHESLRTSFHLIAETPVQRVHEDADFKIEYYDLTTEFTGMAAPATQEGPADLHHHIRSFIRPFDLSHAPLLRVGLLITNDDRRLFMVDMHHIISDGTSTVVLAQEFMDLYSGKEIPPLKIQYKDYALWQNSGQEKCILGKQEEWWLKEFSGEIPVLQLPLDYQRPAVQSFAGSRLRFETGPGELAALQALVLDKSITATLYMGLLSIYSILLAKLSGQEEIVIGAPIANRRRPELESMIGMFVNTLALRVSPVGHKTFRELLIEIKEKALEAFENQGYPFEELVEKAAVKRDLGRNPLFDAAFLLQNIEFPTLEIPGLSLKSYVFDNDIAKFDLMLQVFEAGDGQCGEKLVCVFEYCTQLFKRDTIERFIGYFNRILFSVIQKPDREISKIAIISDEEQRTILEGFNATVVEYPCDKTIQALFAEQASKSPDHIALVGEGPRACPIYLTYFELNKQANLLAGVLIEKGVLADGIVAIMMERSIELVIGIMGILKAGGAYLPIEPKFPPERIDYMLKDSGSTIVVSDYEKEIIVNCQLLIVNCKLKNLPKASSHHSSFILNGRPRRGLHHSNLAYIMYTSGSTGRPKAVVVEQRSVVNILFALLEKYPFCRTDSYLLKTTYIFDVSVTELFGWFLGGGRLAILEPGAEKDPQKIIETVELLSVTHINFVPAMFYVLVNLLNQRNVWALKSLRYIFLAGEALLPAMVQGFLKLGTGILLENLYGPTEGTVYASGFSLNGWNGNGPAPIGTPLSNVRLYICDKYDRLQPIGIPGELCISGAGTAEGYLNNPELTAEKFINNRSDRTPRTYISYKTGDLARWLNDGNIEFLGRIDHQIKIRGFRIELGEIESRLAVHPQVKEAVVIDLEYGDDKYLCAYIVGKTNDTGETFTPGDLKNYLAAVLPEYMIPLFFVFLEDIPLSPSGKINRGALPKPGIAGLKQGYSAPRDAMEEKMAEIWAEVLNINTTVAAVGIDENFFQLGGHSLKATILAAKIQKAFSVTVPLAQVFKTSTIRALTDYIRLKTGRAEGRYTAIGAVEKKAYYPLSSAQKRLFFLQQMDLEGTGYNIPILLQLTGEIHLQSLTETFESLIRRHESLRTSFFSLDGEAVQRVHYEVDFKIDYVSIESPSPERFIKEFIRPFALSHAPLLRVALVKTGADTHLLILDMHHIISDGTSTVVLVRDFMDLYAGKDTPGPSIQYKDYVHWQNSEREAIKKQEVWWINEFSGEIPVLDLPLDYPRPAVQSFAGNRLGFEIRPLELGTLREFVAEKEISATLYMALLSIYSILLAKVSGQEEIVIGAPVANRRHPDLEPIIGMFVNTLALRVYPEGHKTFKEFLKEIKEKTLAAFENQEYPFEELVEEVVVNRDPGRNPLFDTAFLLQNIELPSLEIPGLILEPYPYESNIAKFDLLVQVYETAHEQSGEKLVGVFEYCTSLFKHDTIERFSGYFNRVFLSVIENPGREIAEIEIISESEKEQILFVFNNTAVDYPRDKTIHQIFVEQASNTPDRIVVVGAVRPVRQNTITYGQLNEQSDRLAGVLIEKGVLADDVVAIMMERSIDLITGILGILKAGSAYLPIDPEYPKDRIDYMLKESRAVILLTDKNEEEIIVNCKPINTQKASFHHSSFIIHNSNQIAYVMYTSGSTGKPKGAMVTHRNVIRLVKNTNFVPLNEETRILQTGAPVFDATTFEIWGSLLNGGQLVLVDKEVILNANRLAGVLVNHLINTLWLSAPLFNQLQHENMELFAPLGYLLVGGDVLTPAHINRVRLRFPLLKIINGYGPTENTTFSATYLIEKEFEHNIPIGRPIANSTAYIYDKYNRLTPLGVTGELVVGGDGVALGYLNNPELTAEKFINNRSYRTPRTYICYKTGDLARWLNDSNIEYLGRIDQQVKIRGFRIELEEIEKRLLTHGTVKEAVVVCRESGNGNKYLCAYISVGTSVNRDSFYLELKEYLAHVLPDYMLPTYFVLIDRIPLTANGKVDRKALPEPETMIEAENAYTAPRDWIETMLAETWAEVLEIDKAAIGRDANFFNLGGHSLKAVSLIARIEKRFQVKISLTTIFTSPTIREMAKQITPADKVQSLSIAPAEDREFYPLTPMQQKLFVLNQLQTIKTAYNMPSFMIVEGKIEGEKFARVFSNIICRHATLRTSFIVVDKVPVQRVHREVDFELEYAILAGTETEEEHIKRFIRPFDLSRAPLLRVGLLKISGEKHILQFDMHHIISDGTSAGILIRDMVEFYKGNELPPLKLQYKDFSQWFNGPEGQEMIAAQEAYWLDLYKGKLPTVNMYTDYPRPPVQSFAGDSISFSLGEELSLKIRGLMAESGTTLFMVLLAGLNILLSAYTGQEDIVVGAPIAGRMSPDLNDIIALFINTLPTRNYPRKDKTFKEFLAEVKENTIKAFENQLYPFATLLEKLNIEKDLSRNPLFDIELVVLNMDIPALEMEGLSFTPYPQKLNISQVDIDLFVSEQANDIHMSLLYCTDILKKETVRGFIEFFKKILSAVVANKDIKLSDILPSDLTAVRVSALKDDEEDFGY